MRTLFTESPFFLVIGGLAVTAALVVVYSQTRDRRLRPWIVVAGALTLVPIITSSLIETEAERIRTCVYQMANAVRQNDVDGLLRYIDPEATATFNRFEREMPQYEFSACNVAGGFQKLEVDGAQAVARFAVFVNVNAPRFNHQGPAIRGVELKFRKRTDGRWIVTGFDHFPTEMMQRLLDNR